MKDTFNGAVTFNQPVGRWDTSSVTSMYGTSRDAFSFSQNLGNWVIAPGTGTSNMFQFACMMEVKNLPHGMTSASTHLDSCFACLNCPPGGGECRLVFLPTLVA
mmetsp:Transcript_11384/g.23057  ORF Transcript_11384/g.23057 Transcript_11384/m.23057 type:complete len:104 (+) Transcript_11384:279-590(+)